MTRTLGANMQTAIAAQTGNHCFLYEFQFDTAEYYTDGGSDVDWNAHIWTAVGGHLSYQLIQETPSFGAQSARLTLDGVDTTILTTVLDSDEPGSGQYIGRKCIIRLCHFDSDGTVTTDPVIVFSGDMNDSFTIEETSAEDTGNTCRLTTRLTSPLGIRRQKRGIRADVHSHQRHYSTDTFFRHMSSIANSKWYWGREWAPAASFGTKGGSGGPGDAGTTGGAGDDDDRRVS